jgi:FixJ family two-component response regulator
VEDAGEKPHPLGISRPNVYIVDDDSSVRKAISRFLLAHDIRAEGFDTAESFLVQLSRLSPGSMIVDVQLPGLSGLDLLAKMALNGLRWPAVVISGSHEGHEAKVSAMPGPIHYLRKPFDPALLLQGLQFEGAEN